MEKTIKYNKLFEFETLKYENGKSIGKFKKINEPVGKAQKKIELYKEEIKKYGCIAIEIEKVLK